VRRQQHLAVSKEAVLRGELALPQTTYSPQTAGEGGALPLGSASIDPLLTIRAGSRVVGDQFLLLKGWVSNRELPIQASHRPEPTLNDPKSPIIVDVEGFANGSGDKRLPSRPAFIRDKLLQNGQQSKRRAVAAVPKCLDSSRRP
jgi:hypothetical protein